MTWKHWSMYHCYAFNSNDKILWNRKTVPNWSIVFAHCFYIVFKNLTNDKQLDHMPIKSKAFSHATIFKVSPHIFFSLFAGIFTFSIDFFPALFFCSFSQVNACTFHECMHYSNNLSSIHGLFTDSRVALWFVAVITFVLLVFVCYIQKMSMQLESTNLFI